MFLIKNKIKEELSMGDKIDDFEILQLLGEGAYGYVAKVKSKINHKIYAIKQIKLDNIKSNREMDLIENEISIMQKLNHPLIIKYYKNFKSFDSIYIVMEFIENGDLARLIKAHILLNKPIEEDRLWNIFIQALRSLVYIHSNNIIHRDIKPENIFIKNNGIIKIGDFGLSANYINNNISNININMQNININYQNMNMQNINMNIQNINMNYQNNNNMQNIIGKINCKGTIVGTQPFMSPEMIKENNYDLKTDVYSMGCTFFQTMFWITPEHQSMENIQIINNNNIYSLELINLVKKMIELNKEQRPDSKTILKLFINEFTKKYSKNSGIGSVLSCLYSCSDLVNYYKNQEITFSNNLNKKNISFAFFSGLNSMNNNLNIGENWKSFLCNIRIILAKENNLYENDMEINPRLFLSFLLKRLHQELNLNKNNYYNPYMTLFTGNNEQNINKNKVINYSDEEESYKFFLKYFNENNNSIITNNFYGNMYNKIECRKCLLLTYSFNSFNFVTFNLDLVQKSLIKYNSQNIMNELNISDCFSLQNNILIKIKGTSKICRNCKKIEHLERKRYYTFPKYLIVCLDRGNKCQNNLKIKYNPTLNLKDNCKNSKSYNNFRLIGIIKRLDIQNKEHYLSIYFDCNLNSWILRDDSQCKIINSPKEHNQGIEIMFFYEGFITNFNSTNTNTNHINLINNISKYYNTKMNTKISKNYNTNNCSNNNNNNISNNMNSNNINNINCIYNDTSINNILNSYINNNNNNMTNSMNNYMNNSNMNNNNMNINNNMNNNFLNNNGNMNYSSNNMNININNNNSNNNMNGSFDNMATNHNTMIPNISNMNNYNYLFSFV